MITSSLSLSLSAAVYPSNWNWFTQPEGFGPEIYSFNFNIMKLKFYTLANGWFLKWWRCKLLVWLLKMIHWSKRERFQLFIFSTETCLLSWFSSDASLLPWLLSSKREVKHWRAEMWSVSLPAVGGVAPTLTCCLNPTTHGTQDANPGLCCQSPACCTPAIHSILLLLTSQPYIPYHHKDDTV